uniref:Uncharacterized protein n=1 Tax=Melanopsichium pennsylvanicum 4 TaxID=1398559 RepID=A0A077R5M2_9BASI|nr:putative protein [Melanopsichium pennsylvanicum 4]
MASSSTSAAATVDCQTVSRKPSKLLARSTTLHRSPHGHSGSGAGLWLANSPSPKHATFPDTHTSQPEEKASSQPDTKKKVYHFSASLALASFGASPMNHDPIYPNGSCLSDDEDVDLDLSFDYISRFDRNSSSSDRQGDSSESAIDSSREREVNPFLTSRFSSPDDTSDLSLPPSSEALQQTTPNKPAKMVASGSKDSISALSTTPSPNSKALRSMRANADWDKRKKAPPAPLNLTPFSEAKRERQLALQPSVSDKPALPSLSVATDVELRPASGELVGKSIFSPITPATVAVPFDSAPHASEEPLPLTPLSATRRGAAVNYLPTTPSTSGNSSHDSAAIRRAASTSAAPSMSKLSSDALRRTPTANTCSNSHATPVQRRARSQSNRSFRASTSLASLGPPPFPPPNEPLPSPALSPSFQQTVQSESAYHTPHNANLTGPSRTIRTRPSIGSVDFSEAARSLRSRTTQGQRSSLDSFRTANSDGLTVAASTHSISDRLRWESSQAPPLPPLQRYEAIFSQWDAPEIPSTVTSANLLGIGTASTLFSLPMTQTNTVASSAPTMTWSMSDRSTPSTHHSPLTPFSPIFSDLMPGTATSSKTHFTSITRPSISSDQHPHEVKFATHTAEMVSLGEAGATLKQKQGRDGRNTEQWILTQCQARAALQNEEQQQMVEADAARISIRADDRATELLEGKEQYEVRSRQESRSTDATHEERQTMVISTVSTPDERPDPFMTLAMQRGVSDNAVGSSAKGPMAMTRNRSGTTGPWAQSPMLLNFADAAKGTHASESLVSPAMTAIAHSEYATPQLEDRENKGAAHESFQASAGVQGLGLDFGQPPPKGSGVEGFAPLTTDLLRAASRCMNRNPSENTSSPHLSIQMSPNQSHLSHRKSKEAVLTRGSRRDLNYTRFGLDVGPSPVLPNDCRSPRTASGKELGSAAPGGLSALVDPNITVHRAQLSTDPALLHSQSIASSISAFMYNPTPAPLTISTANANSNQHLDVPAKARSVSIGWRRTARSSKDNTAATAAQTLSPGMPRDGSDIKFVNIDLDDGGLETEVKFINHGMEGDKGGEGKAGQWVSKLWSAVSSPRRSSFGLGGNDAGDRSVDIELANPSSQSTEPEKPSTPAVNAERIVSRGSFRPLSLVEKRQSSGRYNLDLSRQRFRPPTPVGEDQVAEKDARAVALRLLAGSPRLPDPTEDIPTEAVADHTADLSAEEREKERLEALKRLRRMSAVERQRKRNSGIGYITTPVEPPTSRLAWVQDDSDDLNVAAKHEGQDAVQHCGLSRAGSASKNQKRISMTVFGGKERASGLSVPTASDEISASAERAWLDAMRSPRVAESPSGFTPRMTFNPQDWNAPHQKLVGSDANHIPLMLSSSATVAQRQVTVPVREKEHGLTVSELDRAREEMKRLAGQGMVQENEQSAGEIFHTPLPGAPETWSYAQDRHQFEDTRAQFEQEHQTSALGDFGISPDKKEARLHRRTRTARFADSTNGLDHEDDQPTVSIFTRSHTRGSQSFSVHGHHQHERQPPLLSNRSRSKRSNFSDHAPSTGHGLFATPSAFIGSNTPSKNMFWAGFLGMPWLWMIGGWYLTPDGQLRHPSANSRKVDLWQHEPSMQQGFGSANTSPNPGSNSTMFGTGDKGTYDEPNWDDQTTGLGLSGLPSGTSYAASSTNTANSAKTSHGDPNRIPLSADRKGKKVRRSLGSLLDTNPQVSFYQSPVRTMPEPQLSFASGFRPRDMGPVMEVEERARRLRLFAGGYPEHDELHHHHYLADSASPIPSGSDTIAEKCTDNKVELRTGYKTTMAHKQRAAVAWKDLERYVLLNRVAAILSGVLVVAGFTGAVFVVVRNF